MIDLNKIKAKRAMKFVDFKAAVGAPADMDFDALAAALADYCDLDYMMFACGNKRVESCGISHVYNKDFPGFKTTTVKSAANILDVIDDLVYGSDLYFSREQIKSATSATDADIDEYLENTGGEFSEELCVSTEDGKAYRVLTEDAKESVINITQSCVDSINRLMKKIEDVAAKGGPCAIADTLEQNMPGLCKNVRAKAEAFKASDYKGQMPQWVEVI